MHYYVRVYSKKTVKPIDRKVFIEKNDKNFGYRKMYCKLAKHAIGVVKKDGNTLADRMTLLTKSWDAAYLEDKNNDKQELLQNAMLYFVALC